MRRNGRVDLRLVASYRPVMIAVLFSTANGLLAFLLTVGFSALTIVQEFQIVI